ncbi:ABC transporter ATP-binding protein [Fervidibacillus halotolerans]|uniref:ABC transporter ATP-binding protein n=1 Tax=Fervidibacillus halotolerans TaxID=2980027 RepID=A0A9E8RXP2_9BACI|nr:ABC transporter ATP-binding protein [Fervidibacillus halotolerans]WAA12960.1 ABC transporter ATP-binding protein [Fervidibacillus halotolerans]
MEVLLKTENLETFIGQYHILQGVTFEAIRGEVTVLLGRNGAGKTTTLRTILGLSPPSRGKVFFKQKEIQELPTYKTANLGIGYVPEDQGIFPYLTVEEHFKIATKGKGDKVNERIETTLALFPDLKQFWRKQAGVLSGGQKQMLAIARAYINYNELLMIDEPSKGLAPIVVEKVMETLERMKGETTIILVEQNYLMAEYLGDRFYIIDDGKTVLSGEMKELKEHEEWRKKYLGIS